MTLLTVNVNAAYGTDEWPPVGEVHVMLGDRGVRMTPDGALRLGHSLIEYSLVARQMSEDVVRHPGLAEGILVVGEGGRQT